MSGSIGLVNPQCFTFLPFKGQWKCNICPPPQKSLPLSLALRHESTRDHTLRIRMQDSLEDFLPTPQISGYNPPPDPRAAYAAQLEAAAVAPNRVDQLVSSDPWLGRDGALNLGLASEESREDELPLSSRTAVATNDHRPEPSIHGPALEEDPADQIYDDWSGALSINRPQQDAEESVQCGPRTFDSTGTSINGFQDMHEAASALWDPIDEIEAAALRAEGPADDSVQGLDGEGVRNLITEGPHYMDVHHEPSQQSHWPWKSRKHCTLDVLGASPRSLFSESELDAVRWFANANGVQDLPSVKTVKRSRADVTAVAGSKPRMFTSPMKNMFVMADLATIIQHVSPAIQLGLIRTVSSLDSNLLLPDGGQVLTYGTQEFANPLVVQHLQTVPEDSGEYLGQACQGRRWRHEVDANLACPMARGADGHDYFVNEVAMAAIGRQGGLAPVMVRRWYRKGGTIWASVNPMLLQDGPEPETRSLIVDEREASGIEVPLWAFRLSVVELLDPATQRNKHLPSPARIAGVLYDDEQPLRAWEHPTKNEWRQKAAGARVVGCPLWLYCDDTSGNTSKKWNKHNSILFTLAGLPRSLVHLMFNIHYLATSNLASPLEMMDQVVEQLSTARDSGIRAWDAATEEYVLVVPWILAFLGDNPMSSEFASHVGMQGKCFCRCCHVRGADEKNRAPGVAGEKARLEEFLKAGTARTKANTLTELTEQLQRALSGAPSAIDEMATQSGCKDKYFAYYVARLQDAVSAVRERQKAAPPPAGLSKSDEIKQKLQAVRDSMPQNLFNPALLIPEFDPNQDTPFEALHVVLLGAVKYFWRDAVSRQTAEGKNILKTRLDALDVSGLGIPRLRGHTLVQYAGSLVGRDFRAILQVAPAVLYDLIPAEAYEAWLALCRLAPLIFQPEIHNLSIYLKRLEEAIQDFLAATALWSTQWFNKPKFHLFVHLPFYIRRFGPAILYATEGFESYNFLIRLRSVHSNRHAPSADIGEAFSFLHAVRHLVSGGHVEMENPLTGSSYLRQAGEGVRGLLHSDVFRHLMGMDGILQSAEQVRSDMLALRKDPEMLFAETQTSMPGNFQSHLPAAAPVLQCVSFSLPNDDVVRCGGWVLYRKANSSGLDPSTATAGVSLGCARVVEILTHKGPTRTVSILLAAADVANTAELPYRLPAVKLLVPTKWMLLSPKDIVCTVHVFHNCARHSCKSSKTKSVVQERQETAEKTYEIVHTHPDDVILNLAQLTNAPNLSLFRPGGRYPNLLQVDLIARALDQRAQLSAASELKKLEKARQKAKRDAAKQAKAQKLQPANGPGPSLRIDGGRYASSSKDARSCDDSPRQHRAKRLRLSESQDVVPEGSSAASAHNHDDGRGNVQGYNVGQRGTVAQQTKGGPRGIPTVTATTMHSGQLAIPEDCNHNNTCLLGMPEAAVLQGGSEVLHPRPS
ncbi:hypothetical protein FKP32DRAFT_1652266 [Trametes sanguinea]|nr:hypothetical protein FKP32DRAFT_1652266 [Trametes sanguinea]